MENRPVLRLAAHQLMFDCFMTCHMMRTSNGFGPNGITLVEIREYETRFGKLPFDDDILVRLVKKCDEVALEYIRSRMKGPDG